MADTPYAEGEEINMRGAVLYAPGDVRFEERDAPRIVKPTDAIIRMSATCVCGSDLWSYRGVSPVAEPSPLLGRGLDAGVGRTDRGDPRRRRRLVSAGRQALARHDADHRN